MAAKTSTPKPRRKISFGLFRSVRETHDWVKAERAKSPISNRIHEKA